PTKQDTAAAHGEPPGEEELRGAKEKLGWPQEPRFHIPDAVQEHFRQAADSGRQAHQAWKRGFENYREQHPELAAEFERVFEGRLPDGLEALLPAFEADEKGMATRAASGKALNALAAQIPELIGGSADLTGSNKTELVGEQPFSAENRSGRYIHYGIREHGMAGILSGMALHGGLIPYGGTFLVFSDYLRPTARLAAMMGLRVIYVLSHDSVGLGEDGPTHQPIEQLAALRAVPNLSILRPADANETAVAWMAALDRTAGPTVLALTRQPVATLDRKRFAPAQGLRQGAYVLADLGKSPPDVILMASGSEVSLIVAAGERLAEEGAAVRLVSFPSWDLFAEQSPAYQKKVLPPEVRARVAIEAGSTLGWERWVGDKGVILGLDRFGASAPYQELYHHLGLTAERVVEAARAAMASAGVREGKK
ncbi:MAG: transketolase C-terminal domain-containing protein, partial [Anaerolineales bacterium]